jgi:hypothetical protein
MTATELDHLRGEIAAMRIVKCRMQHEQFHPPTPDGKLRRIGLCDPQTREERLGCSHSTSRVKLREAIKALPPEMAAPLLEELTWLDNQIHLLDHRKGDAEAQKVGRELQPRAVPDPTIQTLEEMEREHDDYVEEIGRLRDTVLAHLDQALRE